MQKYKAIKTEYGYLIISDKKSNNYLTAYYYDGQEVVASNHEIYSKLPSFDVPEEWEEDVYKLVDGYANNEDYCCTDPAKEKYKWTDEDMEKMFELGWLSGNGNEQANYKGWIEYLKQPKEYEVDIEFVNNKVIIKSWKNVN